MMCWLKEILLHYWAGGGSCLVISLLREQSILFSHKVEVKLASSRRCVCVRPAGQTAWGASIVAGLFNSGSILNSLNRSCYYYYCFFLNVFVRISKTSIANKEGERQLNSTFIWSVVASDWLNEHKLTCLCWAVESPGVIGKFRERPRLLFQQNLKSHIWAGITDVFFQHEQQ